FFRIIARRSPPILRVILTLCFGGLVVARFFIYQSVHRHSAQARQAVTTFEESQRRLQTVDLRLARLDPNSREHQDTSDEYRRDVHQALLAAEQLTGTDGVAARIHYALLEEHCEWVERNREAFNSFTKLGGFTVQPDTSDEQYVTLLGAIDHCAEM